MANDLNKYANRGMDVLRSPHYMKHVQAMTAEQLHSKADIAAELAFRDIEIERLTAERDKHIRIADEIMNHCCPDGECGECARICCPHKDPMHFHHDGCPSCAEEDV